jgi:hypothetical protein
MSLLRHILVNRRIAHSVGWEWRLIMIGWGHSNRWCLISSAAIFYLCIWTCYIHPVIKFWKIKRRLFFYFYTTTLYVPKYEVFAKQFSNVVLCKSIYMLEISFFIIIYSFVLQNFSTDNAAAHRKSCAHILIYTNKHATHDAATYVVSPTTHRFHRRLIHF